MINIQEFNSEETGHRIQCDKCGEPAENSDGYPYFYGTTNEAREVATLGGFIRIDGMDICRDCSEGFPMTELTEKITI